MTVVTAATRVTKSEIELDANLNGRFHPYLASRNCDNRLTEQQTLDLAFAGVVITKGGSAADRRKRVRWLGRVAHTLRSRRAANLALAGQRATQLANQLANINHLGIFS